MKLKTITAKVITYRSRFGEHVFSNVPVHVVEDVEAKSFDPESDDFGLGGDLIEILEREMAKRWLQDYAHHDEDGNHLRRWNLTADEINGIFDVLGVNPNVALARAHGRSDGTESRGNRLAGRRGVLERRNWSAGR